MIEQKTVIVTADESSMNGSINTELASGWILGQIVIFPSGTSVILFYTRNTPAT